MKLHPRDPIAAQLRACLAAYPARPAEPIATRSPGLWERAAHTGVAAILGKQLGLQERGSTPQQVHRTQAAMGIRSLATLRLVLDVLGRAGIRCAPLKGPILAARLHDDYTLRPTSDVDILVGLADGGRAVEALLAEGGKLEGSYAENRAFHERYNHHLGVIFRGMLVEVHHRASAHFGGCFPSEPLLARARSAEVLGLEVNVLDPVDEWVYLAVHAAGHSFGRDVLLLDLRLLAAKHPLDWARVEARAREFKVHRAVGAALVAARARVGLNTDGVSRRWYAASWASLRAFPETLGHDIAETSEEALANLVSDALWSDTPWRGARYLGERVLFGLRRRARARLGR